MTRRPGNGHRRLHHRRTTDCRRPPWRGALAGRLSDVVEVDVGEARGVGSTRAFYYFTCCCNVYRDVWPLWLRFILHFPPSTRRLRARSLARAPLRFIGLIRRRHMAFKKSLSQHHPAGVNYGQLVACTLASAVTARSRIVSARVSFSQTGNDK